MNKTRLTGVISAFLLSYALFSNISAHAATEKLGGQLVITAGGGLMGDMMEKYFYKPFEEKTGVKVIRFDIEIQDQWARMEAMARTGAAEFDIVTATGPDLIEKADILYKIDCASLPDIVENGVDGACEPYGVARTTGGMLLAYNDSVFKGDKPTTWADFWDVKKFPGPRGLPDTGDRDWWVPAAALMADGVPADKLFPMDLDRAYKKLDQIKKYVAVWWKSGNQVQQIMRDNEVVMTMSYSGRALQAIKDSAPFVMSWDQALRDTGYMSIFKGTKNPKAALAFLDFMYQDPTNHPTFMRAINYATSSKAAMKLLDPKERPMYATSDANNQKLVKPDFKWIGDHRDQLRKRWVDWITQ